MTTKWQMVHVESADDYLVHVKSLENSLSNVHSPGRLKAVVKIELPIVNNHLSLDQRTQFRFRNTFFADAQYVGS